MATMVFFQAFLNALMLASLYSLVAVGLTLVFGVMHMVNFAHGAFVMLGAYATFFIFTKLGLGYWPSLILCFLAAGVAGSIIERFLYHRFWGHVLPCLVVAVGVTQILQNGSLIVFGITEKSIDSIFPGVITIFGLRFSLERLMVIVISAGLIISLMIFLKTTKTGQAMRAVAQDYDAAALLGVKCKQITMLAMFIGCGLAAASGGIIAPVFVIHAYMGEPLLMKAFLIIILGGMGSLPGAIMAGLLVGFMESFGMTYLGYYSQVLLFVFVILVLMIKPTGLFSGIVFKI